jgi:hypothetical protein
MSYDELLLNSRLATVRPILTEIKFKKQIVLIMHCHDKLSPRQCYWSSLTSICRHLVASHRGLEQALRWGAQAAGSSLFRETARI